MDGKARELYAKVEKYGGWQQVPADKIHSIFIDVLRPAEMGFVLAKRSYWARQIDADIFHVIKLDALKGGAYGLSYGVSLSYVPYPYVPKLKWHRTLKSVSLDLREQPQVHMVDSIHKTPETGTCTAFSMLGEKCFREELEKVWALSSPRMAAWFDSTRDFAGILAKCGEHLAIDQSGIRYLPGARLVRAFTYANTGRPNEAKLDVDIFLEEGGEGVEARANLYEALRQVSSK
jgi:hypothetical protein